MKEKEPENSLKKKTNKIFLVLLLILIVVTIKLYPLYIEGKIKQDNELENTKNLKVIPAYRDQMFVRPLLNIHDRVNDKISYFKTKGQEESLERDVEIMYLWDKSNDSWLAALKSDIAQYPINNPNDPQMLNYSQDFSDRKMNPSIAIKKIEEIRLECLEAKRRREFGTVPGVMVNGLLKGFLYNFTFFDLNLNEQITQEIGSASSEYYLHYSPYPILEYIFSFLFSLGFLLPWYIGFMIYYLIKKKKIQSDEPG